MSEQQGGQSAEKDTGLSPLEEACLDGLTETPHGYRYRPTVGADSVRNLVIDGMTPPPGDLDDPFWLGAQWAYGQVRSALNINVIPPASPLATCCVYAGTDRCPHSVTPPESSAR